MAIILIQTILNSSSISFLSPYVFVPLLAYKALPVAKKTNLHVKTKLILRQGLPDSLVVDGNAGYNRLLEIGVQIDSDEVLLD